VAALEHPALLARHHVLALPGAQLGVLLDDVERPLRGALVDGKQRPVLEEVDRIIAPLARGDLAAVEIENGVQLAPIEPDIRLLARRLWAAGTKEVE